jgi:chaperonin GroES
MESNLKRRCKDVATGKAKKKTKAPAKRAPAKKAPTKKMAVKKSAAKKVMAKKSAAKPSAKTPAPKPSAKKQPTIKIDLQKLLIPLEDRLLVHAEGPSETTAGGIFIPGTAEQRPNRGRVLAKGRGRRNKKGQIRPLDVSVGEFVLFPEFAGTQVTLEGQDLLILREEEVLGVVS